MARDHHHVVTKGLQRAFASERGQVVLIDKALTPGHRRVRPASASNAFVSRNFSSHLSDGRYIDDTEDKWSAVESEALPAIRDWLEGRPRAPGWDPVGSREGAKMMAALHFARSFAYKERHDELAAEERARAVESLPRDPALVRIWTEVYGEEPTPEGVAALIDDGWDERFGPNSAFAMEQMAEYYNKALDHYGPLHVQAIRATGSADLVLGDCGLVIARADGSVIGSRRLALKDANRQFLPLGPRLAVMFTTKDEGDVEVGDHHVLSLNRFTWEAAGRQVIAHPKTELDRSLAESGWTWRVGRNDPCSCGSGRKAKRCHPV